MKLSEGFLAGLTAFRTNKIRFLLTMLRIVIGVASGLPMIAIGDDAKPIRGSVQMSRPITIDEVISSPFGGVGECHISTDGKRVAYTSRGTITIFNLEKWYAEVSFEGNYPKWSPADPEVLAFLKPNSSGVWIRQLDGDEWQLGETIGEVERSNWAINPNTFEWSVDGRFLAIIVEQDLEEDDNEEDDGIVVVRSPAPTYANVLMILGVATGQVNFQTESDVGESYEHLAWHPSGDWITVCSSKRRVGWGLSDINFKDGTKTDRIVPSIHELGMIKWSPDGTKLALGYCPYDYKGQVRVLSAMMERDSQAVQILNEEYFVRRVYWGGDSRKVFFDGLKGMSRHIFSVDTISGHSEVLADQSGWSNLKGVSQDGRTVLLTFRGTQALSHDAYVVSINSGQLQAITRFKDQLFEYELPNSEVVEWESYDGLVLQGVVVPPLGKSMSSEHPTIVDLHGGPAESAAAFTFPSWCWWAAQGFQVFAPDFRGSQQYQWVEPPTDVMNYRDVMSGIDWLASEGMCDKSRMGVYGFSYGAMLGAYAIGKTPLFRAAVFKGGRYDRRALAASSYGGFDPGTARVMGGTPWEIPRVYDELSPTTHVANVKTPVLILHGENDAVQQAVPSLYTAYLRGAGVEVEFVLYKGAGHNLGKASYDKDAYERGLGWFRKHLIESD